VTPSGKKEKLFYAVVNKKEESDSFFYYKRFLKIKGVLGSQENY
jgi:hypothetical protein